MQRSTLKVGGSIHEEKDLNKSLSVFLQSVLSDKEYTVV